MSAPETIADLEGAITAAIGAPQRDKQRDLTIHTATRINLRRWLVAKGVSETKAHSASLYVLNNAWNAGDRYIQKMIDDEAIISPSRPTRRRRQGGIDLTPAFVEGELDGTGLLDEPSKPSQTDEASALEIETSGRTVQTVRLDADAIARAAEAVIAPRLANIKTDLQATITTNLKSDLTRHIESLGLGTHLTDEVRRLATDAAMLAAEKMLPKRIEVKRPDGTTSILPGEPRHKKFDVILRWLMAGTHVYIVGPAGTGKTHLFSQLAAALQKPMIPIGQSLTKYDLSGYKSPTGEYIGTLLREAIEFGGLVCIDEGDMWAAAALGFLNSPIANGWCSFPDRVVEVHPDFQVILAANTFGQGATSQYVGRNPLDAASRDRFVFVEVDYDEDLERQIYGQTPWLAYVHKVRKAIKTLGLQHIVSMRAIDKGLKGFSAGFTSSEIAESVLFGGLAADSVAKIKNLAGEPPTGLHAIGAVA